MQSKFSSIMLLGAALAVTPASAAPLSPSDVDDLLEYYFFVQRTLAMDDLDAAQIAAMGLSEKAASKGAPEGLVTAADAVAEAADLKVARTRFRAVSRQTRSLVEAGGTGRSSVYVLYCPMAFDRGGIWLQEDAAIANPYWGTLMPRCGRVMKRLGTNHSG